MYLINTSYKINLKKILCVMLAMIMAFSACACGGGAAAGDRTVTDLVGREVHR